MIKTKLIMSYIYMYTGYIIIQLILGIDRSHQNNEQNLYKRLSDFTYFFQF